MDKTSNAALQELAEALNGLQTEGALAKRPDDGPALAQKRYDGITDKDILDALLLKYKDEPEIARRLQDDFLRNKGALGGQPRN